MLIIKGYDLHLIIKTLAKFGFNFNFIPKSKEKYLALSCKFEGLNVKIRFVDSMHFIPGSLSSWVIYLVIIG